MLRKGLIIFFAVIFILIIAGIALPYAFKDDIRKKLIFEVEKNVEARVRFDDMGLSIFSNFPDITVSLDNFSVVGKNRFAGDTLTAARSFSLSLDLMSVISGDKLRVTGMYLDKPKVHIIINENGDANYDIYKAPETPEKPEETEAEPTKFALSVDYWEIEQGHITYLDQTMPMFFEMKGMNHEGKGDFTQDVFDLLTETSVKNVSFDYGGTNWLSKKKVNADINLEANLKEMKFTFKDNRLSINDFPVQADGFFAMPENGYNMDINFKAKENTFKNLLSLIPQAYMKGYEDIETSGNLSFNGHVKGRYTEEPAQMPGFGFNLKVENGEVQYPDLPKTISAINVDLGLQNESGNMDSTRVHLKDFHMEIGKNPLDASALITQTFPLTIKESHLNTKINLADVTQAYPVEGVTLEGLFSLNASAEGVYGEESMPSMEAAMKLEHGLVNASQLPSPIQELHVESHLNNPTGKMKDMEFSLNDLDMKFEGNPFHAQGNLKNFEDYQYNFSVKGILDLSKLMKLYPMEGMTLAGMIDANISTSGRMSYIEKGQYQKLPTSGKIKMNDFKFVSKDYLPQGFRVNQGVMSFTPYKINLKQLDGHLGKSDINVTGNFSNYMGYMFGKKDTVIHGEMTFQSDKFNTNEWMTGDATATEQTQEEEETGSYSVIEVPEDIDFVLHSSIGELIYTNMNLKDLKGDLIVKNGRVKLRNIAGKTLGGTLGMSGTYDTQDMSNPKFDFGFNFQNMSIGETYKTFNTVQKMAPAAKNVEGSFSGDFDLRGGLEQDMMPAYKTLNGSGRFEIPHARIKKSKTMDKISSLTKLAQFKEPELKDVVIQARIEDGKLIVKPFTINAGKTKMDINGSTFVDGTLDYMVKTDIPAGKVGQKASDALSNLTGASVGQADRVRMDFKVTGPSSDPKVKPAGVSTSGGGDVKQQAREKVKKEAEKKVEEKKKEAEKKAEETKKEAEKKVEEKKKETKEKAEKKVEEEKKKAKEEVDKKKEETKEKTKDKLKDNLGF